MKRETIIGTLGLIALIACIGCVGRIETHYNRTGTVVDVENGIVSVADKSLNIWEFEGDGFEVGQKVTMKMFNNYTENDMTDDVIEGVRQYD